jgi:hypothetical protein
MKYLCLVYFEPSVWDTVTPAEDASLTQESLAYDRELMQSGHFIAADALQPVHTATTIRVRNGKVSTTDGPFAETKEVLGGFILINASDLDDACRVAAKIPLARMGSIEVRPIMEIG